MYKRRDKKVLPMNVPLSDGVQPGGGLNQAGSADSASGVGSHPHQGLVVPQGSRLTPERLVNMKIGGTFLSPQEKQLFITFFLSTKVLSIQRWVCSSLKSNLLLLFTPYLMCCGNNRIFVLLKQCRKRLQ
jgi:hypothetical protein